MNSSIITAIKEKDWGEGGQINNAWGDGLGHKRIMMMLGSMECTRILRPGASAVAAAAATTCRSRAHACVRARLCVCALRRRWPGGPAGEEMLEGVD